MTISKEEAQHTLRAVGAYLVCRSALVVVVLLLPLPDPPLGTSAVRGKPQSRNLWTLS